MYEVTLVVLSVLVLGALAMTLFHDESVWGVVAVVLGAFLAGLVFAPLLGCC